MVRSRRDTSSAAAASSASRSAKWRYGGRVLTRVRLAASATEKPRTPTSSTISSVTRTSAAARSPWWYVARPLQVGAIRATLPDRFPLLSRPRPALARLGARRPQSLTRAFDANRQIAHPLSGRMVEGVGDRRCRAHDAQLADALAAHRVGGVVPLVQPDRLQLRDVGVGGDVVAREVMVGEVAEDRVDLADLQQRHRQAHRHGAQEL